LHNSPKNWSKLKGYKVLVIRYDPPEPNPFVPPIYRADDIEPNVHFWGGAWEFPTILQARSAAFKECGQGCTTLFENDDIPLMPRFVKEYQTARQRFIATETKAVRHAERVDLLARAGSSRVLSTAERFSLNAGGKVQVGYPDWQQDYSSACQDRVFYALYKVRHQRETIRMLDDRASGVLYASYNRSINTVGDYTKSFPGRAMQRRARFMRPIEASSRSVALPPNLAIALKGQHLRRLWLEGSVRLINGEPFASDSMLSPVAILTDRGLYLGVQLRLPDDHWRCYVGLKFRGEVIDAPICAKSISCAQNVYDVLVKYLIRSFSSAPIHASIVSSSDLNSGEFAMAHEDKPSDILGSPYYERNRFDFSINTADDQEPFGSLYGRQTFSGTGGVAQASSNAHLFFFLTVEPWYSRAIQKNSDYIDPTAQQQEAFEDASNRARNRAVANACQELHGTMNNEVCILKKAVRQ
jgi:hypothetical protein